MPQVAQLIGGAGTGKTTELPRLMDGQENINDKKRHGTHRFGHKLSPSEIVEIRALTRLDIISSRTWPTDSPFTEQRATISYLVNRKTWKEVG